MASSLLPVHVILGIRVSAEMLAGWPDSQGRMDLFSGVMGWDEDPVNAGASRRVRLSPSALRFPNATALERPYVLVHAILGIRMLAGWPDSQGRMDQFSGVMVKDEDPVNVSDS